MSKDNHTDVVSGYHALVSDLGSLIESGRRGAARAVNAVMTATYWLMGRRIVEFEQGGSQRAEYGTRLLEQLALDLERQYGRGFRRINLQYMRGFYLAWPENICQTLSDESSAASSDLAIPIPDQALLMRRFPLPWSAYVRLLSVESADARDFYESEALRAGWSVRQLDRQICSIWIASFQTAWQLRSLSCHEPSSQSPTSVELRIRAA